MSVWILVGLALAAVLAYAAVRPRRREERPRVRMQRPMARSRRVFLGYLGGAGLLALGAEALRRDLPLWQPASSLRASAASPNREPVVSGGAASLSEPAARLAEASTIAEPTPIAAPAPAAPRAAPRQPNVLLVTVDTLRADRVGAYGFARAQTPNFDLLAAEGARFTRAICQLPQTNASHAALFTGLYPSTSGVRVHMVDKLRSGSQTLASVFAAAGYRTAGVYSWVSLDPQFSGLDQGFQSYQGFVVNRSGVFANEQLEGLAALYRQLKDQVPIVRTVDLAIGQSAKAEESMDGRADVTTAAVLDWLDGYDGSSPFCLWVHYFDPHYPYAPPAGYDHVLGLEYAGSIDGSLETVHAIQNGQLDVGDADRERLLELYQGEIAYTDAQVGRLLDGLRRRDLLDDTIVVLTADHGESFGEHGEWAHGLNLYQNDVHVPLVLRYPRAIPAGLVVDAPAQLIDVLPTLTDLAGIGLPRPVQGSSLLPPLLGTDPAGDERIAFSELADLSFVSLVAPGWKIVRNNANGELQLFDLSADPGEQYDVSDEAPGTLQALYARLAAAMRYSGVSK